LGNNNEATGKFSVCSTELNAEKNERFKALTGVKKVFIDMFNQY
jgi:hypothetical protein